MICFSSARILTLLQLRNKLSLCFSVCSPLLGPTVVLWGSSVEGPRLVLLPRPAVAARSVRTFGSLSSERRMRAHSDALRPELIRCFVAEAHLLNHSVQSDGGSPGARTEDTGGKEAQCGHKREALGDTRKNEKMRKRSKFIVLGAKNASLTAFLITVWRISRGDVWCQGSEWVY